MYILLQELLYYNIFTLRLCPSGSVKVRKCESAKVRRIPFKVVALRARCIHFFVNVAAGNPLAVGKPVDSVQVLGGTLSPASVVFTCLKMGCDAEKGKRSDADHKQLTLCNPAR